MPPDSACCTPPSPVATISLSALRAANAAPLAQSSEASADSPSLPFATILPHRSKKAERLEKRLLRAVGQAVADYQMIAAGDRIAVCVSGGKDSLALLSLLLKLRARAPVPFELVAVNLDQGQPGFPVDVLPRHFEALGVPYRIVREDTYAIVRDKIPEGKTTCSLCSRLRRAILYRTARELGCNKLALGHHRDDILETFFLNLFFGGTLKAMPPKLRNDEGDLIVIRPLAYCQEAEIERYARAERFPIIPCNLCGSLPNAQRQKIKAMLRAWEAEDPRRVASIFTALQQVAPSHLLDRQLFDFARLS